MSLNRLEQRIFDYLQAQPEERQFWLRKVQTFTAETGDDFRAAGLLDTALWRYYLERAQVVPLFRECAAREGLQRTSLRNLAEYLIRLWIDPRPKPKGGEGRPKLS